MLDQYPPPIRRTFSDSLPGLTPAPVGGATGKILRDDGSFVQNAMVYKGGVAGNAVPATSTTAGDYYLITSNGTSQGKTWVKGEIAVYEGSSGNWTQLAGVTVMVEVTMPTTTADAGNPGEYAISADEFAIYKNGTGWVFFSGVQK